MSDRQSVKFTAPVRREALDDPSMVVRLTARLLAGARMELDSRLEGRSYRIEKIRMVISGDGPSFIRGLFDAEMQIDIELA